MDIKLSLALPRDGLSVPIVRRVLRHSMQTLGVDEAVSADVELALTEACTNVLDHVAEGDEYEVSAGIHGRECVIEVIDTGRGFDDRAHGFAQAAAAAESGRGIQLMRALVDEVSFSSRGAGTVVHLEKRLTWPEEAPIARLTEGRSPTTGVTWSGTG